MCYLGTSLKNKDFEVSILYLGKYSVSAVNYHPMISMVFLKYMALLRSMFCTHKQWKVHVNMGPWMLCLWVMAHFILEGEGWKMNCKLICRKVLICEWLISTLQITILMTAYKKYVQVVVLVLLHGMCYVSLRIACAQKLCVCYKIDLPLSSTLFCSSATSLTVMTFTVFLRWLQKWKPARFKSVDIVGHAFGALWRNRLLWIVVI